MPKNIVLCVDDEPIVLRLCSIAIAEAGFRPVVAENGAAGLEVFMQLKDEICLVLSDVIMPAVRNRHGGKYFANRLASKNPSHVRVQR